jgi:hypothetical protein
MSLRSYWTQAPHLAGRISHSDHEASDSIWAGNRPAERTVLDLDEDDRDAKSELKGKMGLIPGSQMAPGYGGSCWSRDFTRIVPMVTCSSL